MWKLLEPKGNPPQARYFHTSVVSGDGKKLVTFGGFNGKEFGDTPILDLESLEWQYPEFEGSEPPSRHLHASCAWGNKIIVCGGDRGYLGTMLNDVFILDLDKNEWKKAETRGEGPCPRWGHSIAVAGGKMYLHGGYCAGYKNDLFELDLETLEWKKLIQTGDIPPGIGTHSIVSYNNRLLLGPGFMGAQSYSSDIYLFNLDSLEWRKVFSESDCSHDPESFPAPRSSYRMSLLSHPKTEDDDNISVILHGGFKGLVWSFGDTWVFDVKSCKWTRVTGKEGGLRRRNFGMGVVNNKIYVFGGYDQTRKNDLHMLEVDIDTLK